MKTSLLSGLLVWALAVPAWAADKAPFDRIVVFGTSLSDPGNAFALLGTNATPPDWSADPFLVPDRPYAKGGHHFSDGPTWIEQLAKPLGLATSARPAFRDASSGASNYAVGGARARSAGGPFDLPAQVSGFLADFGNDAPSGALYVIEMGGNDVRDALVAGQTGGQAAALAVIQAALESMNDQIMRLYVAGARSFLVWNVPDIGRTPAINPSPVAAAFANQLAQGFNGGLDFLLAQLGPALPGIQFTRLDVYAKLNTVIAQPQLFGLSNVTAACITPNAPPFTCKKPHEFLFWDGIHPSEAGHGILADEAAQILQQ
jgi:phospholipase/lecithinase/hemolysin